jgi:hypothetical protein
MKLVEKACVAHYENWSKFHQWEREAFRKHMQVTVESILSEESEGWLPWDENNPPDPGEYFVYHSRFIQPGEKLWSYRAIGYGPKKHDVIWFNDGNRPADGPPEFYCPTPKFPGLNTSLEESK